MDAVAGLLDGPRARGAFLLRSSMTAPWAIRIQDEAPLTLVAVVRGHAWLLPDVDPAPVATGAVPGGTEPGRVRLGTGDVAVVLGPEPYAMADDPGTPPQAVIHPGQRCTTPDGGALDAMRELGVRTWGNAGDGETELLTGTYAVDGEVSGRLLRALPRRLVLRDAEWSCPVVPLLADEMGKDQPGQEAVLDRLLDVLLIAVLRAWFDRPDAAAPGWYRASADPVVGTALSLLHHEPARPWTVAQLASAAGVSRALLARRFHELVGEPPMAFLTGWRIALAADLLREPGATVGSVAHEVGYGSAFALSTAFKRVRGVSPSVWRATAGRAGSGATGGTGAAA